MQHPKELNIGDIVYHKYYGIGQIEDIDKDLGEPFQYLVYYYKEKRKHFITQWKWWLRLPLLVVELC